MPHLYLALFSVSFLPLPLMYPFTTYTVLLSVCGLVVVSYLFSLVHRALRIPSVLLLLFTGILLGYLSRVMSLPFFIPMSLIEGLGTVGLIMIVLEAGLDLEIRRERLGVIRKSFFSALIIFILSTATVAGMLKLFIPTADLVNCVVYAIPLSIVSSAIVLPSVHHLGNHKREFLVYEATFSDLLGIMVFNFFTTDQQITLQSVTWFFSSIPVSLVLSMVLCFFLLLLLVKNTINVKFFLLFSMLVIIYITGKMMHLPSLITIFAFGLVVNNWEWLKWPPLHRAVSVEQVNGVANTLKEITAESSFLIRTFFFVLFGFNIDLAFLKSQPVLLIGSSIVLGLLALRFVYLRIIHKYDLFPELFYIPRGLITILLFYKIPQWRRLETFDEGILFFVILATALIMMAGSIFFRDRPVELTGTADIADSVRD